MMSYVPSSPSHETLDAASKEQTVPAVDATSSSSAHPLLARVIRRAEDALVPIALILCAPIVLFIGVLVGLMALPFFPVMAVIAFARQDFSLIPAPPRESDVDASGRDTSGRVTQRALVPHQVT